MHNKVFGAWRHKSPLKHCDHLICGEIKKKNRITICSELDMWIFKLKK